MGETSGDPKEALTELLCRIADGGGKPDNDALRMLEKACRLYPYATVFPMLRLLYDGALSKEERAALQKRIALSVDDPRTIDKLRGMDWAKFYPEKEPDDTDAIHKTDDAIDLFLNTYGHSSPEEDALLERMIFNPAPDYAEILAREEQENLPDEPVDTDTPQGRIDAFILSCHPAARSVREEEPDEVPQEKKPIARPANDGGDALLSESLARIYVRQGRYKRAYDLIASLNGKYPEKSVYFGDQLRFLRKLIINQEHAGK